MKAQSFRVEVFGQGAIKKIIEYLNNWNYEASACLVEMGPLGKKATPAQNDQQHAWFSSAEQQGDMKAHEYRAECKAFCGIPILLRDSEEFRDKYNRIIKPLPYEQKLELMIEPFDFPVTRLMTKAQKSEYLDAVYQHLTVKRGLRIDKG